MVSSSKIFIVVVTYNTEIEKSDVLKTLSISFMNDKTDLQLLIYDNSLNRSKILNPFLGDAVYRHNPRNGGLAEGYNYALSLAEKGNYEWLLLLDQDSRLSFNFLANLLKTVKSIKDESVVAIAPRAICSGVVVSPRRVLFGGRLSELEESVNGPCDYEIMSINSGLAVKVSFMKSIDGFNEEFWLDFLDHWLCRKIYAEGKKIYVSAAKIEHQLSVGNYNQIPERRSLNILQAEINFYKNYKSRGEQIVYFFRLLFRSLKQYLTLADKNVAKNTLKGSCRLFDQQ